MQELMSGTIEEQFVYDTFISYHAADKHWVTESLINSLEDQDIKVCWDDRDFEVGKTVIDNKLNAIWSSTTTVVIISPDYTENEEIWLHLGKLTDLKQDEILKKFFIIPIIYRNGKIPDLFKPIWKLDWTNQITRKFFWTKLVQTIKNERDKKLSTGRPAPRSSLQMKSEPKPKLQAILDVSQSTETNLKGSPAKQHRKHRKQPKSKEIHGISTTHNSGFEHEPFVKTQSFPQVERQSDNQLSKQSCTPRNSTNTESSNEERPRIPENATDFSVNSGEASISSSIKHAAKGSTEKIKERKYEGEEMNCRKIEAVNNFSIEQRKTRESQLKISHKHRIGVSKPQSSADKIEDSENRKERVQVDSLPLGRSVYDDTENQIKDKLMESINPRILSIFVPEDDDLSRQDIEELTFRIEDVLVEEEEVVATETPRDCNHESQIRYGRKTREKKNGSVFEKFCSAQEQMHLLDVLQQKEVELRSKFQKCCNPERKKTYRRLLERLDRAIFSAVNGRKDKELLSNLPIPEVLVDESRGCQCPCCDRCFHSERALHIHTEHCVKLTWMNLLGTGIKK